MKSEVPQYILDRLESILKDEVALSIMSTALSAKLKGTSIAKLKYMSKLAPQYLAEYYAEMQSIVVKADAKTKVERDARLFKKFESNVRCFRCEGTDTRKCGVFTYQYINRTDDIEPESYKQRYECKNCEYPDKYFYYVMKKNDSSIGYYIHPAMKKQLLMYDIIRAIHLRIKYIENAPPDHKFSSDTPVEFLSVVNDMKGKNNERKKKHLPKRIEQLSLEIKEHELTLDEKKKLFQSAVQALNELDLKSRSIEPNNEIENGEIFLSHVPDKT